MVTVTGETIPVPTIPELWLAKFYAHGTGVFLGAVAIDLPVGGDAVSSATSYGTGFGPSYDVALTKILGERQARITKPNRNRLLSRQELEKL